MEVFVFDFSNWNRYKELLVIDYQPFRRGWLIENLPIPNLPINF